MPFILGTNSIKDTGYNVDNSLRFNKASGDYLNRTQGTPTSRRTFTYSGWIKISELNIYNILFESANGSHNFQMVIQNDGNGNDFRVYDYDGSTNLSLRTTQAFRDVSAWYHIVLAVDTTQSTASNRVKLYVNGTRVTAFDTETYMNQNYDTAFANGVNMQIGRQQSASDYFQGYMCEVVFIDGSQLAADSFGEFDSDSPTIWKPIDVSGLTFGTNGFYLPFTNKGKIHTVTANGGVHHETDQKKLGSSSIEFDGNGDYLSVNDIGQFVFEQDFTVEFFARLGDQADNYTTIMDDPANHRFRVNLGSAATSAPKLTFYSAVWDAHTSGTSDIGDGAWHHCAIVRDNGTLRIFVDGSQENTRASSGGLVDVTGVLEIGRYNGGANLQYEGYLDEIRISNIARYTSGFTPTTSAFADDEFTRLLIHSNTTDGSTTFTDSSGVAGGMGNDESGNNNDFISNNINSSVDQSTDTCTNNFATMNPLDNFYAGSTFSEGNLQFVTTNGNYTFNTSTFGVSSGKWYAEVEFDAVSGGSGAARIGVAGKVSTATSNGLGDNTGTAAYMSESGQVHFNGSDASYGDTYATGDVIGIALDVDNSKLYFSKNGTFQNSGDPTSGATGTGAISITAVSSTDIGFYFIAVGEFDSTYNYTFKINFGSPPYSISSSNADANGHGNFEYAVPSGYFALCSKNLAEHG